MTGLQLFKYFQQKAGYAYTGSLVTATANDLFRDALISSLEKKYRELLDQKEYDEIRSIIKTEKIFALTNNAINITPISGIVDYWHLLTVKAKFTKNTFYTVAEAINATPIIVEIKQRNNLRTGERLLLASVIGNTNTNGLRYAKKINQSKIALYSDKDFQTAIAGNGTYTGGGTISRIHYEYCKMQRSDTKIGEFNKADIDFPLYEITENLLKIYPIDEVCEEITIDYVSNPPTSAIIQVQDNVIDLELFYPVKFLYYVIDSARTIFAEKYRDPQLYQQAQASQQQNK